MYDALNDLHIFEGYCGEGVLGYTTPSNRHIYLDSLKLRDEYDKLRVLVHEKQHNVNPDATEYENRLLTDLRLKELGIPTKPSCCFE